MKINITEIKSIYEERSEIWEYVGLRFENKYREIGEICECSKHNPNRTDERDFPEFGSEEYDSLPEREGTCAYDLRTLPLNSLLNYKTNSKHCYIVVGDEIENPNTDLDDDEIIIIDAEVVEIIF